MRLIAIITFTLSVITPTYSHAKYEDEVGFGLGMAMLTLTETPSKLEGDGVSEPESGSVGAISGNIYWKFLPLEGKSFYLSATVPMMMISSGDNYLNLSGGFEYYFSDSAHRSVIKREGLNMTMTPTLRYFAFAELGIGYASYTTDTAKKNDTFFEGGGGGGLTYTITQNWAIKATAGVTMGAGVLTNPMVIKVFAGGVFFLGE